MADRLHRAASAGRVGAATWWEGGAGARRPAEERRVGLGANEEVPAGFDHHVGGGRDRREVAGRPDGLDLGAADGVGHRRGHGGDAGDGQGRADVGQGPGPGVIQPHPVVGGGEGAAFDQARVGLVPLRALPAVRLQEEGALLTVAAANYSQDPGWPDLPGIIAVSATSSSDSLASFSNFGAFVDVAAPGVSIRTTYSSGSYGNASGTSFASPVTAGVVALIGAFIPYQVFLYPLVRLFSTIGIYDSLAGIVTVHIIFGMPIMTLLFRNFYSSLPRELFNAARVDGGGFLTIFWRVMLPMSTPMLIVATMPAGTDARYWLPQVVSNRSPAP